MKIRIANGRVLDPANNRDEVGDVYVLEGTIVDREAWEQADGQEEVLEAGGCWVVPGLIDLHAHLREPGYEYKETIATGTRSAAKGGFSTVCPMPNTKPATDSKGMVELVLEKARTEGVVHVLPVGAVTLGQEGKALADFAAMKEAGICGLSEDGRSVLDARLMRQALAAARELDIPMLSHCEDESLARGGCMNEGVVSSRLGFQGIPGEAEDIIAARDIILAHKAGARLHLCHVSTKESVAIIREAKRMGVQVTAEVCPHHFTLTEEAVDGVDANTKMNPPLRTKADVDALLEGLSDGTIDAIATDHAPHSEEEKACGYAKAANGIVGFETAVPLVVTELVEKGILDAAGLVRAMSLRPARILGSDKGTLGVGRMADITIIDPQAEYAIDAESFASKGRNTPFNGRRVRGKVMATLVAGKTVYRDAEL
ncbi:dihydroorotase [Anaerotalea alkaliphila]|uniref:Dihydroorotase n=1 Tax=Anaerotalea alkaliphila TaxID=2662126 RepID=A0A7X5HX15_9FIRM|nr:dihydroorotase [Anaerotalea alkaliphila]NDL68183.1 dihydroorotase [Anaerotalea alkaliphila]